MRKWLIFLSVLVLPVSSSFAAWRWVDDNGVVHYSDRPAPGAVEVELRAIQGFSRAAPAGPAATQPAVEPEPAQTYQAFDIVSPAQQETFWNIGGTLGVTLAISPGLQPGHTVDLLFDGQRRGLNASSPRLTLTEVYRGVHTLQAVILDPAGMEIVRSLPVEFMVQQTSILNPNNPNSPVRRAN
jgi:hypothetical protein